MKHRSLKKLLQNQIGRYVGALLIISALSLPAAYVWRDSMSLLFLKQAGEIEEIEEIVERQIAEQALYGSAIFEDDFAYKLELVRRMKPKVIALGSSRALQFRAESFDVGFVNAGRAMNDVEHGRRFVDAMLKIHKPDLILLTLDFWWLNGARQFAGDKSRDIDDTSRLASIFWGYVDRGRITKGDVIRILAGQKSNAISNRPSIGIAAMIKGQGYRADGSRDYGARYFGLDPSFNDYAFKNFLREVSNGSKEFPHGISISHERLSMLRQLVDRLQDNGVNVIGILPPIADRLLQSMNKKGGAFSWVQSARKALQTLPIKVYDFTDPSSIGANDCEFADGAHAGDVAYQRMLIAAIEDDENSFLANFVNMTRVSNNVRRFTGHAVTVTAQSRYQMKEIDFLGLGCKKSGIDGSNPEDLSRNNLH